MGYNQKTRNNPRVLTAYAIGAIAQLLRLREEHNLQGQAWEDAVLECAERDDPSLPLYRALLSQLNGGKFRLNPQDHDELQFEEKGLFYPLMAIAHGT